jgi:leucyl-tRNA synthetase
VIIIQINGKKRANMTMPANSQEEIIFKKIMNMENIKNYIKDENLIKNKIYITNKIFNIVI